MRKSSLLLFAVSALLLLGGCRQRILAPATVMTPAPDGADRRGGADAAAARETPTPQPTESPTPTATPEPQPVETPAPAETPEAQQAAPPPPAETPIPAAAPEDEPGAAALPDEASERREYSETGSGELAPDAETPLYEEPAEDEAPAQLTPESGEGRRSIPRRRTRRRRRRRRSPAEEADRLGADEDAEAADSVLTYYLTLLSDRVGPLFECKRLNVYWETAADHTTVFKSSPEHDLILQAGAYDVSARLLEENLAVDDGWVLRKDPDAVVKVVEGGALDGLAAAALCGELAAREDWAEIGAIREGRILILSGALLDTQAGRTAAAVYLAKLLYPEQMADVDADAALRDLTAEAAGGALAGLYAYSM
jgi:hypothetical protein